ARQASRARHALLAHHVDVTFVGDLAGVKAGRADQPGLSPSRAPAAAWSAVAAWSAAASWSAAAAWLASVPASVPAASGVAASGVSAAGVSAAGVAPAGRPRAGPGARARPR